MADPIRVLLVDDHGVLRSGLRLLLDAEPDITVVGEAADGGEGIRQAEMLRPDVVVMDLTMPGVGGVEATRRICSGAAPPKVLVLTVHDEEEFLHSVVDAGASGYLTKTSADRELVTAIRAVARGEVFLHPKAAKLLLDRFRGADQDREAKLLERLTPREREVMSLTAEGFSSTEIGKRLKISSKTVDTYRARLMQKLELRHRSELVRFALRTGLLRE